MTIPDSIQVKLLRERYKQSLPDKSRIIDQHLTTLAKLDSSDEVLLKEIREDLHKFAGSSGMYGYTDIASSSREAMTTVDVLNLSELTAQLTELRDLFLSHADE